MATTVGATKLFHSEEHDMANDPTMDVSGRVQTFVMEFDQEVYEAYRPGPGSPMTARGYRKIVMMDCAHAHASTTCFTPRQPSNLNIQVGVASTIDNDAGHLCCNLCHHIFLPVNEMQVLKVSLPFKRNQNVEHHRQRRECKQ